MIWRRLATNGVVAAAGTGRSGRARRLLTVIATVAGALVMVALVRRGRPAGSADLRMSTPRDLDFDDPWDTDLDS